MGKKGGWITALKKAFTSGPKDKPTNGQLVAQYSHQHRSGGSCAAAARDKKRWGFGRSRQHAEPSPAGALINIPLYREPSSIEKILVDAEMEQQHRQYRAHYQITPAKPATVTAPAAAASLPAPPPPVSARERQRRRDVDDDKPAIVLPLPPPSPPPLIRRFDHDREQQQKLQQMQQQTRAETEWRRPQAQRLRAARPRGPRPAGPRPRCRRGDPGVVRGPSVRRQTAHAMRCMQMLVRVQSQVRASRVEAMERRNRHHHAAMLRDAARWRAASQDGGIWEDSLLSRDEMDARTKRKVEAVIKRERALAYAYSHQLLKATPMAAHAILADLQSGRNPWWWTPIERRHEAEAAAALLSRQRVEHVGNGGGGGRHVAVTATPARSVVSSYSTATATTAARPRATRPAKVASSYGGGGSIRDDESLTSCPAFGGALPNYMTPTMSASAKARARAQMLRQQQEKQAQAAQEKPRFSFGLGQSIGSWAKSPFWKGGAAAAPPSISSRVATPAASVAGRHRPTRSSVSELSVDSAVSMPAGIGRRTFK
ncbi:hypothetical protein OsJ_04396 [Oryza sativa Japonica Group]|uniref:Uncharacterized protein n=1 Tax=Oryza sativa subsp. japonica TaxID=39947 RepID=A3A0H6_ORYSJ|nr:hypothetical protein OsJ_04396 [Oryza sativa Japonica Group]